jgi:hypothetical protein
MYVANVPHGRSLVFTVVVDVFLNCTFFFVWQLGGFQFLKRDTSPEHGLARNILLLIQPWPLRVIAADLFLDTAHESVAPDVECLAEAG